jgi:hypothetical protein
MSATEFYLLHGKRSGWVGSFNNLDDLIASAKNLGFAPEDVDVFRCQLGNSIKLFLSAYANQPATWTWK